MSGLSEYQMGDQPLSHYDEDIPDYGQAVIVPQNTVRLATSADGRFDGRVGNGGSDIEESISKLSEAMQQLYRAVMYGDERDIEEAADGVEIAVDDLENTAKEGTTEEADEAEDALDDAENQIMTFTEEIRRFNKKNLRETPKGAKNLRSTPNGAKYIGTKEDRDGWRQDIEQRQDEINQCRAKIMTAKREISRFKRMITKDKRMERKKTIKKGAKTAYGRFYKAVKPSESKIPSVGGTLKAEGTLPVGDRLSDGSKGSAFFHSIIGCEDKEDFEHEFNIANRFFKKQYGLDFSDENPEVVKDGLKRTIGDVVTMEPFGMNHKITHKVETANMHIGELSPAGSDVYDGGFKVEVKQPIELGGNFEREAEDAVVPAGTKMLHGYMDLMDASGDNSAVRIAYRTKQPIVASGGNTYSMVGNLVSHEAPKFAIKRTLYVNKKGGDNHVVMATEFGH